MLLYLCNSFSSGVPFWVIWGGNIHNCKNVFFLLTYCLKAHDAVLLLFLQIIGYRGEYFVRPVLVLLTTLKFLKKISRKMNMFVKFAKLKKINLCQMFCAISIPPFQDFWFEVFLPNAVRRPYRPTFIWAAVRFLD